MPETMPETTPETTKDPAELAERLRSTLDAMTEAHDALLDAMHRRRAAIRTANADQLAHSSSEEASVVARISELDQSRRELAVRLASALDGRTDDPHRVLPRISELSNALGPAEGESLEESGRRLREVVKRTQTEARTMRAALRDLVAHTEGLMVQVSRRLSDTGTYSPRGGRKRSLPYSGGIDVTR